jgi:UDP-glucose 4-epimerase
MSDSGHQMGRTGESLRINPKEERVTEKNVVLVTGVAGYWGSQVAARLMNGTGYHVIGLDREKPAGQIGALDFIKADVRNALLLDLLKVEQVDTICHLAFVETKRPSEAAFDLNVMGTTNLLRACADAGVRKVVLKSSTAVYGARPGNSAFLTEDHALRGSKHTGTIRDRVEIEKFCNSLHWQAPGLMLTVLRFANIVGPAADTPMTQFLREPWIPSLLGFDPRMQIIHEADAIEALVHAVNRDTPGVFNVAAEDILPLNKIRGLAGKPSVAVFHPFAYWGMGRQGGAGRRLKRHMPFEPDYLRYPYVADLRSMRQILGFEPRYTAEETLREFAEHYHGERYVTGPIGMAREEESLRAVIEQRQRAKEQEATTASSVEGGEEDE